MFHLAGVNRPKDPSEFYAGNRGFTEELLHLLAQAGNKAPVLVTSSVQAGLDNDYGKSKRDGRGTDFRARARHRRPGAGVPAAGRVWQMVPPRL